MAKKLDIGVVVRVVAAPLDPRCVGMVGTIVKFVDLADNRLAKLLNIGPWIVELPQLRNLMCTCGQHMSDGEEPFHSHEIVPLDDPDKQEETLEDVILELEKA